MIDIFKSIHFSAFLNGAFLKKLFYNFFGIFATLLDAMHGRRASSPGFKELETKSSHGFVKRSYYQLSKISSQHATKSYKSGCQRKCFTATH
jgi:hypothetical protein